jgi:hypothetical protein
VLAATYTDGGRLGKVSGSLRCSDREHSVTPFAGDERGPW